LHLNKLLITFGKLFILDILYAPFDGTVLHSAPIVSASFFTFVKQWFINFSSKYMTL